MDKAFDKLTWQDVHRPGSRGRRGVATQLGCSVEKKTLKRTQELIIIFLDLQVRPHIINKPVFSHFQRTGGSIGYTILSL